MLEHTKDINFQWATELSKCSKCYPKILKLNNVNISCFHNIARVVNFCNVSETPLKFNYKEKSAKEIKEMEV